MFDQHLNPESAKGNREIAQRLGEGVTATTFLLFAADEMPEGIIDELTGGQPLTIDGLSFLLHLAETRGIRMGMRDFKNLILNQHDSAFLDSVLSAEDVVRGGSKFYVVSCIRSFFS